MQTASAFGGQSSQTRTGVLPLNPTEGLSSPDPLGYSPQMKVPRTATDKAYTRMQACFQVHVPGSLKCLERSLTIKESITLRRLKCMNI